MKEMNPCPRCGGKPNLVTGYDFEYVICEKCKCKTETEIGDYYDEGYMDGSYVIPRWNAGIVRDANAKQEA